MEIDGEGSLDFRSFGVKRFDGYWDYECSRSSYFV